jgi:hypothetical protein
MAMIPTIMARMPSRINEVDADLNMILIPFGGVTDTSGRESRRRWLISSGDRQIADSF